jgi:hypothetical protein
MAQEDLGYWIGRMAQTGHRSLALICMPPSLSRGLTPGLGPFRTIRSKFRLDAFAPWSAELVGGGRINDAAKKKIDTAKRIAGFFFILSPDQPAQLDVGGAQRIRFLH